MDRKFYPENFERFLRGHADQFKMSPSKKVWHGIYNDLHPGRRWPSVAVSMLFIFTLVIIGHLNTNNGRSTGLNDISTLASTQSNDTKSSVSNKQITSANRFNNLKTISSTDEPTLEYLTNPTNSTQSVITNNDQNIISTFQSIKVQTENTSAILNNQNPEVPIEIIQNIQNNSTFTIKEDLIKGNIELITNSSEELKISEQSEKTINAQDQSVTIADETTVATISKLKRKNNVSWSYYVTPSLGYRNFSDDNMDRAVTHQSMFGHEAGTAMNVKLFKNLEFTSGLQLNYSGYNIKANNTHPAVASLMLKEPGGAYSVYSTMSHYGNSATNDFTKLKNYSFQASVPIGLQYKFAETENFKLGAAASFQPTIILASQAYLLSSDKRNYLTNSDIIRNWNMNTSFSTFVSFTSNSLNWQIGPQVRYQLLSTYNKRYPITENLVNYGIRVGITKPR